MSGSKDVTYEKHVQNRVRLADSYFLAADDASSVIDPLPMYYGAMSLGLGIAYATLSSAEMREHDAQHGMVAKLGSGRAFLDGLISFATGDSTFGLVARAFGGDDIRGRTFDVRDLMCLLTELDPDLESVLQRETLNLRAEYPGAASEDASEDTISLKIRNDCATLGWFRDNVAVYEYLVGRGLSLRDSSACWKRNDRTASAELNAVLIVKSAVPYFAANLKGVFIPEYAVYLSILHFLSILCRYHPETWLDILDSEFDEAFLIGQFMHLAEMRLPNLALNHLARRSFIHANTMHIGIG